MLKDPSKNTAALVASKDPNKIRGMFSEISPTYDTLNHALSLNVDKLWRRKASRLAVTSGTRNILDVCCGTGDFAISLAAQANKLGSSAAVTATDFTPQMCTIAKRKFAPAAGSSKPIANCAVADTLNLPFADHSFDLVTVAFGIRNVADTRAGISEMVRVCRPGGTVAVLEFSHPSQRAFRALYFWYFFSVLPRIGALISRSSAYRYLSKSVADFPDTSEFCRLFAEVSGAPVTAHRFTLGIATLYITTLAQDMSVD